MRQNKHCLFLTYHNYNLLFHNCNLSNYLFCLCGLQTEGKNALWCLSAVVWVLQKYQYLWKKLIGRALKMCNWRKIDFIVKQFVSRFSGFTHVVCCHWTVDMCSRILTKLWKHNMAGRLLECPTSFQAERSHHSHFKKLNVSNQTSLPKLLLVEICSVPTKFLPKFFLNFM